MSKQKGSQRHIEDKTHLGVDASRRIVHAVPEKKGGYSDQDHRLLLATNKPTPDTCLNPVQCININTLYRPIIHASDLVTIQSHSPYIKKHIKTT